MSSTAKYQDLVFKIPVESETYRDDSAFVIQQITAILDARKFVSDHRIIINTNLKSGLPLKDINKIAGPMIKAWAFEVFAGIRDDEDNVYSLINAEAQERLDMADIILQFRKGRDIITGNIDVKATADDIPDSGKSPNITSFSRIRTAYISGADISYNPALGTGQIQVKDIHYVSLQYRTTWEMCQMLDRKFLNSKRRTFTDFYQEAVKNKWLKE